MYVLVHVGINGLINKEQDSDRYHEYWVMTSCKWMILFNVLNVHGMNITLSEQLAHLAVVVDRPATPNFRFNQPANNMDNFPKNSLFGS